MAATFDFQLSKTPLHIGDTLQAPTFNEIRQYRVYFVGAEKVYLERDIHMRDTTGWLQPFGGRYVDLVMAGLRQGDRIKREGHTGEFVVKNVIYKEGAVVVTEYIELNDLAGWTIVRPA